MRIAGSTFSFGDITLEAALQILNELGFDLADVGARNETARLKQILQQAQ